MEHQHVTEGVQDIAPQNMLLWHIILSHGHLKNSKSGERLSLNSPYLPKDSSSRSSSIVIGPHLQFHQQGRLTVIPGQDSRSGLLLCPQLAYSSPIFLRSSPSLLKISYSPLRGLHTPYPCYRVFRPEFKATSESN